MMWSGVLATKQAQSLQTTVLDYLKDLELEQTAAYARSGRSFANMTDEDLHEAWFDAMQAYACNPTSLEPRSTEAAVRAELFLRGLEPPWEFASCALSEIRSKAGKIFKGLAPAKLEEIDDRLTADLVNFLNRRDSSNN
jgi:hypothetical protein